MRHILIYIVVISGLTHSGCMTSPFPMSDPATATLDLSLEGVWEPLDPDPGDEPSVMHVIVFNEHEYYIEFEQDTLVDGIQLVKPERIRMRAFLTVLDGQLFANAQELGTDDKDYMFLKLGKEGTTLALHTMTTDLFEDHSFTTPEELAEYVLQHADDKRLYDEEVVRYRKQVGNAD